ncbi:DUF3048 domain-containing protein [Mesobacillus maritimus]|uniref:DUF3048 domain-containing protein n=1 Tax=Mesobacillus maritimus TaxID=1643336 RepID=A0ABS7K6W3_9BACI|nr:DUF3048 domain-containing protein [Mesobacillus maritimus]MBY0097913.1 DUF3048 domain-containing protein [Mesobacillus maritimus]
MLKKWIVVAVAAMIITSGCSQEKNVAEDQPKKQVEDLVKDEQEPAFHYPLTGLETEEEPSARAVAVVVNNHPKARPQSGLHKADLVYEVLAEGNVTRFLAIFESEKPENIGPVRSAREYYLDLAKGYDSFFVAHGFSPEAKRLLNSDYIDNINGIYHDGTLFKRADFRQAPHNSYITFENIEKGAENGGYSLTKKPEGLMFFEEEQLDQISGEETRKAQISYGTSTFDVEYEYDAQANKYHRYSNGEDTIDLESKEAVLLDNILIVEMDHQVIDNDGRKEINLTSGGSGYLLQKGIRTQVTWENVDGRILPFINGEEAKFVPGKTWINIVPDLDRVTF